MRITLLLGILAFLTVGMRGFGAPAQTPAAPRERNYNYVLIVQFGLPQQAPILRTDLALGAPFGGSKPMDNRLIVIGGQIEAAPGGKFSGILTLVDYFVSKEGKFIGANSTSTIELELDKSVFFEFAGGAVRGYTITLTKKRSQ